MPPKKVEAPPPPKEDTNIYGVFVHVNVESGSLYLIPLEDEATTASKDAARFYLSVTYPGDFAPLQGQPVAIADNGVAEFHFRAKFRQEPGLDALHVLLNNSPTLGLHHAPTHTLLACAPLDLIPFGLGEQSFSLPSLTLTPIPNPMPPAPPVPAPPAPKGAPPPPSPPPLPQFTHPPVLHGLSLSLSERIAPADGSAEAEKAAAALAAHAANLAAHLAASSRPSTNQAHSKPGNKGATAAPTPEPTPPPPPPQLDETALPPMLPFRYVPEAEAAGVNVLTFDLQGPALPLPDSLAGAFEAAGGKMSLMAALALPSPGPTLTVVGGTVVKDAEGAVAGVGWPKGPARLRRVLTAGAAAALASHLDDDGKVWVEVGRYMSEDKAGGDSEAAFDAYHARAVLPGMDAFLEGGTTHLPGTADTAAAAVAPLTAWAPDASTALPAYVPPTNPKFKPVEEVDPGYPCAWEAAGSVLGVRFFLARPLLPPWQPPPPPAVPLAQLVPQRDLNPAPPPPTAEQEVQAQMGHVLRQLAEAYLAHTQAHGVPPTPPAGAEGGSGRPRPEREHRALVWELNTSGRYEEMQESLKPALVRLVKERLKLSGNMGPVEMSSAYTPLYTTALGLARLAVNEAADPRPMPPPRPPALTPHQLGQLAERAALLEAAEASPRRVRALAAARVASDHDRVQPHLDLCFTLARAGDHGAALHAAKAALEVDPYHEGALAVTAALALGVEGQWGLGEACGHALLQLTHHSGWAWAVLALVYRVGGAEHGAHQAACVAELRKRERAALKSKEDGGEAQRGLAQQASASQQQGEEGAGADGGAGEGLEAVAAAADASFEMMDGSSPGEGADGNSEEGAAGGAAAPGAASEQLLSPWSWGSAWCRPGVALSEVCRATGVLSAWLLALDLALPGVAKEAQALAHGPLRRSTLPFEPLECALASARTCMLLLAHPPAALASSEASKVAVGPEASASSQPESNRAAAEKATEATLEGGGLDVALPAPPSQQSPPTAQPPAAADPASAAAEAKEWVKSARRMAAAAAAEAEAAARAAAGESKTHTGLEPVAEASRESGVGGGLQLPAGGSTAAGLNSRSSRKGLDLRPTLLQGDLDWLLASLATSSSFSTKPEATQAPLSDAASASKLFTTSRAWYQQVYEAQGTPTPSYIPLAPDPSAPGTGGAEGSGEREASQWEGLLLRAYLRLARSYAHHMGGPQGLQCASTVYTACAQKWPTCAAAWAGAAATAAAGGDADTATALWSQANLLDVEDGEVWEALAKAAFAEGRMGDGEAALERALSCAAAVAAAPDTSVISAPRDPVALLQEGAWAATGKGDTAKGVAFLERALGLPGGDCFQVRQQLAGLLVTRGETGPARAHVAAARRMAKGPADQEALHKLELRLAAGSA